MLYIFSVTLVYYVNWFKLLLVSADSGPTPMETNDGEASSDKKDKKEVRLILFFVYNNKKGASVV